jgi:hypothetical protein
MSQNYVGLEHHESDDWLSALAWTSNSNQQTRDEMKKIRQLYDQALKGDAKSLHQLVRRACSNATAEAQYEG